MTTERKPLPRARARRAWKVALMDLCCLGLLAAWLLFALGTLYPRYLARTAPEEALPYLATAGEQSAAALTPEMTPEARIRAYDLRDNLWRRGLLVFYDEPLRSICRKLERWYGVEIDTSSPTLDGVLYTGMIKRHATLNTIADLMNLTNDVVFTEDGGVIRVVRKSE